MDSQQMREAEFEAFVSETQEKALQLAQTYLGDWDEARDAVQEAFVKAYRKASGFRGDSTMGSWFYRILANHCKDRLRRRKARTWLSLVGGRGDRQQDRVSALETHPDPAPNPAERAEDRAFRKALDEALTQLPKRQQEVFRLQALAGFRLPETAAALGISVGAVKSHLFRATRALQAALAPWREAP
jgi:RNA polymerase sigma-70 factor (ECF subfamily)